MILFLTQCTCCRVASWSVEFRKHIKGGENIKHKARIVTYVDPAKKKAKVISLLTNDMTMEVEDIIDIYRHRWEIELLFKQLKQNFLWGERQRHQDTDLGHPNSQSPSDGHKKTHQTLLELFWIGINGKNNAHVLCELLYFP